MPNGLSRLYEDLANHYAERGESRRRDDCWVLAADAALLDGMPLDAERLRKRLLLTNPNHLLRPYASMAAAMKSEDVRLYVAQLRRELPPERVAKMLNRPPTGKTMKDAVPLARPIPTGKGKPRAKATEEVAEPTALSYMLSLVMFALGLVLAAALLLTTVGAPLQEWLR